MRYSRVFVESIGYELAPNVVCSSALEERLAPVYEAIKVPPGQIELLTGVRERRFWDPGQTMADGAARAGRKALEACGVAPGDIGMLIYGGVCRDNLEPATACAGQARRAVPVCAAMPARASVTTCRDAQVAATATYAKPEIWTRCAAQMAMRAQTAGPTPAAAACARVARRPAPLGAAPATSASLPPS